MLEQVLADSASRNCFGMSVRSRNSLDHDGARKSIPFFLEVRIDLHILIWYLLLFQSDPGPLDERAEPSGVQRDRLFLLMLSHNISGLASCAWIDFCVRDCHWDRGYET